MAPRTNGRKRKTDDLHQEEPEEATRLEAIAEDNEAAQASSKGLGSVAPFLHGSSSAVVCDCRPVRQQQLYAGHCWQQGVTGELLMGRGELFLAGQQLSSGQW